MTPLVRFSGFLGLAALAVAAPAQALQYFSPDGRDQVMAFWAGPGRYVAGPLPDASENGSWRARQTAEGSTWIWQYNRAIRPGKINPSADPEAQNDQQAAWDAWIDRKVALDYWLAEQDAAQKNAAELGRPVAGPSAARPADPGPMPADLRQIAGEAPAFARAVQPLVHTISFSDGLRLNYQDNVSMRRKFAYFRFHEGVQSMGTRMRDIPANEIENLLRAAGISESESRVMKAVSLLEGGFDSVNTYDTGFVSVGFIQFAALSAGSGSLGEVMRRMKIDSPAAFEAHFQDFGLDVAPNGQLVALDPSSGAEFVGPQANSKIISDKRLAAVFQRAGQVSREFRVSQLKVAKEMYYPADDRITVSVGGRSLSARVRDIFRTEAGMATLMDRKVNTGRLAGLNEAVQAVMQRNGLDSIQKAAAFEYDLIRRMQYRKDYLKDIVLLKPRPAGSAVDRSQARSGRRSTSGRSN